MSRESSQDEVGASIRRGGESDRDLLAFETSPQREAGVLSSLDGRPDLRGQIDALLESGGDESVGGAPSSSPGQDGLPFPRAQLVVQSPRGTMETRHEVDSRRFLLGRDECDLVIQDRFVSRWHAQLFYRDEALILQDLDSDNGVYLRIADDLTLEDGDEIVVGQQRLVFRIDLGEPQELSQGGPTQLGAPHPDAEAYLVRYLEGGKLAGAYPLFEETTIGSANADLTFEDDSLLSAPHAAIRRVGTGFTLRDAESQTGTFIRIADAVELIEGDCFLVGRTRVRLTGV